MIDRRLSQRYKRRRDPEDIVQSVLKSFCVRVQNGEYHFKNREMLWALLSRIARNKVYDAIRDDKADKHNIDREQVLPDDGEITFNELNSEQAQVLADALEWALNHFESPFPEIFRLQLFGYPVAEVIEIILNELNPPYPQILQLKLQGLSEQQIAEKLNCRRGKVRYKLQRLKQRLKRLLGEA